MIDPALIIYVVILTCATINFSLGIWWWRVSDQASTVFRCWVVLWGALLISEGINFMSRCRGSAWYSTIRLDWWWMYRYLPLMVVSVFLTIVITRRTIRSLRGKYEPDHD